MGGRQGAAKCHDEGMAARRFAACRRAPVWEQTAACGPMPGCNRTAKVERAAVRCRQIDGSIDGQWDLGEKTEKKKHTDVNDMWAHVQGDVSNNIGNLKNLLSSPNQASPS